MPVTLNMMEYPTNELAQAAYVSNGADPAAWDLLDEDCSDISDWNDRDSGNGVSEVSPAGQFRMDGNIAAAGGDAERDRDVGTLPDDYTMEMRLYCDLLGTDYNDSFRVFFRNGVIYLTVAFKSDGLFIFSGAGYNEVGTDIVKSGGSVEWQTWRFVVTGGDGPNATVDVYLDDELVGSNVDCSNENAASDGLITLKQYGRVTDNMLTHIDYVKVASGHYPPNLQCFSESVIKEQGSYSLKGVALATGSLNKALTRTVSPTIDLSDLTKIKLGIYASRTGSNIKIGIRDSGGVITEITPNIPEANTWQTVEWDISGVSNDDKDAIDRIIVTIVNADADNTFYLDNIFANWWSKIFTEQIVLSDSFSRRWTIYRTFTETLHLTDSVSKKISKIFSEAITLADTIKKKVGKIFTEKITLTDTFSRVWHIYRTFTESITLTDTISKRVSKIFTETLHLQDTFSRVWHIYRTFTEKITLTDKVKAAKSNLINLIKKLIHLEDIED